MAVKIKIMIEDVIENKVIADSEVTIQDYDYKTIEASHEYMRQLFPNACVNFSMDNGDMIYGVPFNQEVDEDAMDVGMMTWKEFIKKWHKEDLDENNED